MIYQNGSISKTIITFENNNNKSLYLIIIILFVIKYWVYDK